MVPQDTAKVRVGGLGKGHIRAGPRIIRPRLAGPVIVVIIVFAAGRWESCG